MEIVGNGTAASAGSSFPADAPTRAAASLTDPQVTGSQGKSQSPPIVDLGNLIDGSPWSRFQLVVLVLASMAFIVDAFANQVMAISIPALIRDWHVSRAAFAPVLAMGWVGVAIGAVLAGTLADRFGRKPMLLCSILLFGLATTACALASNPHMLMILRIFDGIGIGGAIPTATTLIAEFTPARRRSRALNIGLVSIPLGNFLCGFIGSAVLPRLGWQALFVINGGISIAVAMLLLFALPESPRFLAGRASGSARLSRSLGQMGISPPDPCIWAEARTSRRGGSLAALFARETLPTTLAIWGGFFACFLAVYSSLNWMPTLLSAHGFNLRVTSMALAVSGIGGIFGSLAMARLTELFGSRRALITTGGGVLFGAIALILLPLNPGRSVVPLMLLLAWLGLWLNALTGCIYALGAHVYPAPVKGTGLGTASSIGRIGAITSSFVAVAMIGIGSQAYFAFIGGAALVAIIILMALPNHIPSDQEFTRGSAAVHTP